MSGNAKITTSTVIPAMRYRDAAAAIEWLCNAFGFQNHLVVPGDNGGIAHAQLSFGNGMIMLGSARDDEFGQWVKPPREIGGVGTQSAYVIVDDADAHYARAKAAGAEIVTEVEETRTMAVGSIPAAIPKAICGVSGLTTPGQRIRPAGTFARPRSSIIIGECLMRASAIGWGLTSRPAVPQRGGSPRWPR